jgi:hypothetical protein
MKKTIRLNENDLVRLITKIISEQKVVQGRGSDPYQYKEEGGSYFFANKGSENWTQANDSNAIQKIKDIYFPPTTGQGKKGSSKVGGSSSFDKGKKLGSQHKKIVGQYLEDAVETLVSIGKTTFRFVKNGAVAFAVIVYGVCFKLPQMIFNALLSFLGGLAKTIGNIVVGAAKKAKNIAVSLWNKAKQSVIEVVQYIFNAIKSLGQMAWATALRFAMKMKTIWNLAKNWFVQQWNSVKDFYNKTKQEIEGAWEGMKGYVSGWISEDVEMAIKWYNYYNSLPTIKMINEIHRDTRKLI